MNISIEFYASLMKYLPPGKSRFKRDIRVEEGLAVSSLIKQFHISPEEAHIVLVNGHFVTVEDRDGRALTEGDVISIWPPVAGG